MQIKEVFHQLITTRELCIQLIQMLDKIKDLKYQLFKKCSLDKKFSFDL
jgi:hypothetical protein